MRTNRCLSTSHRQRGSALLISLMVMVGLSLLGLGFVAISETENQISVNERNYAQTLSVAEAGAKTVVEWFQNPQWTLAQGLSPANNDAAYPTGYKRARLIGATATNIGVYRPAGAEVPFDKPFFQTSADRFWGTETTPDIQIDETSAATFLAAFNSALFPNLEQGRVTEIKIYAPPIVGALPNASGFYNTGGTRYGVATIKVTARKFRNPADTTSEVVAERSVKIVLSPWPFPGPQGPIQSNANIQTGGNFGVHWGKMTSQGTMEVKLPLTSLPWVDAYYKVSYEYGYPAGPYPESSLVNDPGNIKTTYSWFGEVIDRNYDDPWYEARARQQITNAIMTGPLATDATPFVVDSLDADITNVPAAGWSNWFQLQAFDQPTEYKQVIFPRIDYDFWKEIAVQASASGQEGVYYLWPTAATGEMYTDGATTKTFAKWVNTARATNPARAGFYFFDTVNRLTPQGPGAPGQLADDVEVNSSDDGSTFQMQGFIYLNASLYGTQGIGGVASPKRYNAPGEPFRDIGYLEVDHGTGALTGNTVFNNNGKWDCDSTLDGDDICDIVVDLQTFTRPANGAAGPVVFQAYAPVGWSVGCTVGTGCSEPHEPYLNIIYNANAKSGGGPEPLRIGWQADAGQGRRPKARKPDENLPNCASASEQIYCTSNGYDRDGAFVTDLDPILDGVFYNEGDYDTEGNAVYFGSLLINGNVIGTGTPEVWFDEKLVKGDWPPPSMPIPRVYISAQQTDQ
ncbi:MAG: pilus assembly PilX family protein [Thermoanaerobaculia bacterium]